MNIFIRPKRVCVEIAPGQYALGDLKYTTIDGKYIVHLDDELSEHPWNADDIEFLEDAN